MRTHFRLLVATAAFVAFSTGNAADAPPATPSSNQSAAWSTRKVAQFSPPTAYFMQNGYESNTSSLSCDQIIDRTRFMLVQLGARDIGLDARGCLDKGANEIRTIDLTFSVLEPTEQAGNSAAGAPVAAHWQTVALKGAGLGDCAFLNYVTRKVLPAFSTRNVKLIPTADCKRIGIGLYAQILRPMKESASSPQP